MLRPRLNVPASGQVKILARADQWGDLALASSCRLRRASSYGRTRSCSGRGGHPCLSKIAYARMRIGVRTSRLGSLLAPDDLRRCTPSPGGLEPGTPFHDAIADRHAWVSNRRSAPPW